MKPGGRSTFEGPDLNFGLSGGDGYSNGKNKFVTVSREIKRKAGNSYLLEDGAGGGGRVERGSFLQHSCGGSRSVTTFGSWSLEPPVRGAPRCKKRKKRGARKGEREGERTKRGFGGAETDLYQLEKERCI